MTDLPSYPSNYSSPSSPLDSNEATIGFLRHAEIKHGRVAMFAFVGYCVQSNVHWPWPMTTAGESFPSTDLSPEAQWDAIPEAAKWQILIVISFLELWGEQAGADGVKHYMRGGKVRMEKYKNDFYFCEHVRLRIPSPPPSHLSFLAARSVPFLRSLQADRPPRPFQPLRPLRTLQEQVRREEGEGPHHRAQQRSPRPDRNHGIPGSRQGPRICARPQRHCHPLRWRCHGALHRPLPPLLNLPPRSHTVA